MIAVLDASVVLKWFFKTREETHAARALAILESIDGGRLRMIEPPHFLAEIAAVLAREKPDQAQQDLRDLQRIDWETVEMPEIYATAVTLCVRSGQHLFDTLYHATALHTEHAHLITADDRYYRSARGAGRITPLESFFPSS